MNFMSILHNQNFRKETGLNLTVGKKVCGYKEQYSDGCNC